MFTQVLLSISQTTTSQTKNTSYNYLYLRNPYKRKRTYIEKSVDKPTSESGKNQHDQP